MRRQLMMSGNFGKGTLTKTSIPQMTLLMYRLWSENFLHNLFWESLKYYFRRTVSEYRINKDFQY